MVSRDRLQRLGATVAERATSRRVRAIGQVLLLAAIVFISLRARSLWHGSHIELGRVNWLAILRSLGVRTQLRWAWIYFQAQLAKYIPGSVWQYAGRAATARSNGIPVRAVGVSLPVEFVASGLAGGSMA